MSINVAVNYLPHNFLPVRFQLGRATSEVLEWFGGRRGAAAVLWLTHVTADLLHLLRGTPLEPLTRPCD